MKPRLLDLFCGAGGAARGYADAGFDVVGVDLVAQPRYPFEFHQGDALTFPFEGFDAIHASPTCQTHSRTRKILEGKGLTPPGSAQHIPLIRARLRESGVPYVIENVPGAPLEQPRMLCGTMFGLKVYRHRLFESNFLISRPPHLPHVETTGSHRGYSRGPFITVGGNNYNRLQGMDAMGVDWHVTRPELSQMIPPAYTRYIGEQLRKHIEEASNG